MYDEGGIRVLILGWMGGYYWTSFSGMKGGRWRDRWRFVSIYRQVGM